MSSVEMGSRVASRFATRGLEAWTCDPRQGAAWYRGESATDAAYW
jgi:hypothetical protein